MWKIASAWSKRAPRWAWLMGASLLVAPLYLAYFYRILGAFGVVGCAMPLTP